MEASAGSGSWDHSSDIETAATPSSTTTIVACACAFTLALQSTWTAILAQTASLVSEPGYAPPFDASLAFSQPLASDRSYKICFIVCATALPVRRAVPISSCHGRRARNRHSIYRTQGLACMSMSAQSVHLRRLVSSLPTTHVEQTCRCMQEHLLWLFSCICTAKHHHLLLISTAWPWRVLRRHP